MSATGEDQLRSRGNQKPSDRGRATVPGTPVSSSNDEFELSPLRVWTPGARTGLATGRSEGENLFTKPSEGEEEEIPVVEVVGKKNPFLKDPPTEMAVERQPKKKKRKGGTTELRPQGSKTAKTMPSSPILEEGLAMLPRQPSKAEEGEKQPVVGGMEVLGGSKVEGSAKCRRGTPYEEGGLGEMSTEDSGDNYCEEEIKWSDASKS